MEEEANKVYAIAAGGELMAGDSRPIEASLFCTITDMVGGGYLWKSLQSLRKTIETGKPVFS